MTVATFVVVGIVVVAARMPPAVLYVRCRKVDALRNQKLRESYEQAVGDMNAGLSWEWRFEADKKAPSFNQMVWKAWRPVSSFFPD